MVIQAGKGRTALTYDVRLFGSDLLISVFGGVAHIGSVAVGDCGSLLSYTAKEHKDDALSETLAKTISRRYQCRCVVTAGFHLDDIVKEEISAALETHVEGSKKVMAALDELLESSESKDIL